MECYICRVTIVDEELKSTADKEEDLIFFLRIVLDVSSVNFPGDKLSSSLAKSKEWWKLCEQCTCLLADVKLNYSQVVSAWKQFLQSQEIVLKTLKSSSRPNVWDSPFEKWIKLVNNDISTRPKFNFPTTERLIPTPPIKEETNDYLSDADEDATFRDDDENNDSETDPVTQDQTSRRPSRSLIQIPYDPTFKALFRNPTTRLFTCPLCDVTNSQKFNLYVHYKTVHFKEPVLSCPWTNCDRTFSTKISYILHMDRHKGQPRYQCDRCPLSFFTGQQRKLHHERDHLQGALKLQFTCSICNKGFMDSHGLYNHVRLGHRNGKACPPRKSSGPLKDSPHRKSQEYIDLAHIQRVSGLFHCPSCSFSAVRKDYLIFHYKRKHLHVSYNCTWPLCGKVLSSEESWKNHEDRHKGTPSWKCNMCDQLFYTNPSRYRHQIKIHGLEAASCPIAKTKRVSRAEVIICELCGKSILKVNLSIHKKNVHEGDKLEEDICPQCGETVKQGYLRKHIRIKHERDKHLKCSECSLMFPFQNELNVHLHRKHGIVRDLFRCDVALCRKFCRTEQDLRKHVEDIHGLDKMKPGKFKCDFCEKTFFGMNQLRKHCKVQHSKT